MKPKGNGLAELVDEKHNDNSFFCMKLVELLEQTDYDTWMKAIGENRGIGIATNLGIPGLSNNVKVVELDENLDFCVCMCYPEKPSPVVKMFSNYMDKLF